MKKIFLITLLSLFSNVLISKDIKPSKKVSIYWDASLSMQPITENKKLAFLDAYFKEFKNVSIELTVFNTEVIIDKKDVNVNNSNWNELKKILKETQYDGASNYGLVNGNESTQEILFFTDGNGNLEKFSPDLYCPRMIMINSKEDNNLKFLYETAFLNRGYYIDLNKDDVQKAISDIKERKKLNKLVFNEEGKVNYVKGIVRDSYGSLKNAIVKIKGTELEVKTDENGEYQISASPDDILVFNYDKKKEVEVKVDETNFVKVEMVDEISQLETIIIKTKKENEEEIVNVGGQKIDKKKVGYAVQSIDDEQISKASYNLGDGIAGKISGLQTGNQNDLGQVIIRGFSSIEFSNFPLLIIDDVPLPRDQTSSKLDFLDPYNIENVTVLKGIAATNRYGGQGSNGVILITTKNNSFIGVEETESKKKEIEYKIFSKSLIIKSITSNYNTLFEKAKKDGSVYETYLTYRETNKDDIKYYIDASKHLYAIGEKDKAYKVLTNIMEIFPNDVAKLRILSFYLEEQQRYDELEMINAKIIEILPRTSQPYFNRAKIYAAKGDHKNALKEYKKVLNGKIKGVIGFSGIYEQVENDLRDFLSKRDQTWDLDGIPTHYLRNVPRQARVVLEWSHPQTEYEVDYINPKKQYFTLSHTREENEKVFTNELKEGYNSEEYILEDATSGDWYLNLKVPAKKSAEEEYLKVKVYTNLGTKDQKEDSYIINLSKINKDLVFAKFKI